MKISNLLFRMVYYFRLGHSQWLILGMWFIQFSTIIMIGFEIPLLDVITILIIFYVPIAIVIGYIHIKTNFREEQRIIKRNSPLYQEIFDLLNNINQKLEVTTWIKETDFSILKEQNKLLEKIDGKINALDYNLKNIKIRIQNLEKER